MTLKTLSIQYSPSESEFNLFQFITHESKHIYNKTIFCFLFLDLFKNNIFKDLYTFIDNLLETNKSTPVIKLQLIDKQLYKIINIYYKFYISIKDSLHANNKLIYTHVIDYIKHHNIYINTWNFYYLYDFFMYRLIKIIKPTLENKVFILDNILFKILKSIYTRNYNYVKSCMLNHTPFNNPKIDKLFIFHVKNEYTIFENNEISWKNKIETDFDEFKKANKIEKILTANQTILTRTVLPTLNTTLAYDPRAHVIDKAYDAITSFFKLKEKKIKCNFPKFLPFDSYYNASFHVRSIKKIKDHGNYYSRLTIGDHISKNYVEITKNTKLKCLNMNDATYYKKYIDIEYLNSLQDNNNFKARTKGYLINGKHISKTNKNIIDSYYFNVPLPRLIKDKQIKMVELIPDYDGTFFRFHYVYEDDVTNTFKEEYPKVIPNKKCIVTQEVKKLTQEVKELIPKLEDDIASLK